MTYLPNMLTVLRIALIAAIYLALPTNMAGGISGTDGADGISGMADMTATSASGTWWAFGFFCLACLTDFLDGWLARKFALQSTFGRMFDPIADKLLIAAVLLMLAAQQMLVGVHLIAALLILLREILVAGLREYMIAARIALPVSFPAKIKTALQMLALAALLAIPPGSALLPQLPVIAYALLWLAALLSLVTGYDYLRIALRHRQAD